MTYHYKQMDRDHWDWFQYQCPTLAVEDSCGIVAFNDETGSPAGGCVFDNWTDTSVQCSFLITEFMVLRDQFFHKCATFLFNEMGMQMAYVLVPADNLKSLNFVTKMNFVEVARLKGAFKEGIDYVILELRKENCTHILSEVA